MYLIADHSFVRDDLVKILVTLKQRLQSAQRDKWKRLRKSLQLAEFLLINGSMEYVAYLDDRLRPLIAPFAFYECEEGYEDRGASVRSCAKRILELCAEPERMKIARAEGKRLRTKIVGIGSGDQATVHRLAGFDELRPTAAHIRALEESVEAQIVPEEAERDRDEYRRPPSPGGRRRASSLPEVNFLD